MMSLEKISKLLTCISLGFLVSALLFVVYLYFVDSEQEVSPGNVQVRVVSFNTDKKVYGSRERIEFSVLVDSEHEFSGWLFVEGVKLRSASYVNVKQKLDLDNGENLVRFHDLTPSCTSGCGGVNPGKYKLELELKNDQSELLATSTTEIELVSN